MKAPEVFYARSGDVSIAYQVVGDGPVDLVFVRGLAGELLSTWEQPLLVAHVMGFASFSRVLMLDKRGTGLSDRVREVPTLETRMDDVRTVMDAVGSDRAFLAIHGHRRMPSGISGCATSGRDGAGGSSSTRCSRRCRRRSRGTRSSSSGSSPTCAAA